MAVIDHKGNIRGIAGSVIFRGYGKKNIVQGKPKAYPLTAASITSSSEFGLISSAALAIRKAFLPAYRYYDGPAVGRVTSAVSKCIRGAAGTVAGERDLHDGELSHLNGLEFNLNNPLSAVLLVKPQVEQDFSGTIKVLMPAMNLSKDMKIPTSLKGKAYRIKVRFLLTGFNFRENYYEYVDNQEISYDRDEKTAERIIEMKGTVPSGCMLVLSMSLSFYSFSDMDQELVLLNSVECSPCAIIGSWQAEAVIPLGQPILEVVDTAIRTCMEYTGNWLLAELPNKIIQQARKGTNSGNKQVNGKVQLDTFSTFPDHNELEMVIGKRVVF
ncbi:hypothetical protein ADIARSV_1688 [Arcticibacter svalbardensis MN12-7]|uniref:Uncharacterized protein n=1 Tax=Arcticibacter svalbardensis MN12-7 TaxID=1150600 RepID=R9GUM4_9SPHI|nr:hypothetical protein [Arcticibacter svalbardensis]EOR95200.1 hypothetical protein ADIARSV_1688 [Arcticibacter svalbardensis MN12-7]